ncbi:RNase H family protein [Rhizobium sp. BK176]|uniref:RNase H family protein n=1 Tax=Rhizobium sp. BK176 TaxID=2587071 RepID=UPI00216AAD0B|nr:RNase H family protein [Rhizobium sp. BK176]MCS4089596.1 ribonuclease HI [Rhizobium sp. BK176]
MNDPHRSQYAVWAGSAGNRSPGPGGWASVVIHGSTGLEHAIVSGGDDLSTDHAMELTAVFMGLTRVPRDVTATVFTDSKFVLDLVGILSEGWNPGGGEHEELWSRLVEECGKRFVSWQEVAAGDDVPHQARASMLAQAEAAGIA